MFNFLFVSNKIISLITAITNVAEGTQKMFTSFKNNPQIIQKIMLRRQGYTKWWLATSRTPACMTFKSCLNSYITSITIRQQAVLLPENITNACVSFNISCPKAYHKPDHSMCTIKIIETLSTATLNPTSSPEIETRTLDFLKYSGLKE